MSLEMIIVPMLFDFLVLKEVIAEANRSLGGCDLGIRKNEKGAYDIVAHWAKQPGKADIQKVRANVEAQIRQRYAYEKVKQELAKKGFIVATEEVQPDNTIRLVARKW